MRIQGELLKLGIAVSHTTIATVLRSSGLGPAPRRIGPTWSEFLRAQAHSMLGGGLRDSLDGDTLEPSGWAADGEPRQVEANDELTPTEVAGLGWPLNHYRLAAAKRCRDRAFSLRLEDRHACSHRIDRTLATDQEQVGRLFHNQVLWRKRQKPWPLASRAPAGDRVGPLGRLLGSSARAASVRPIDNRSELSG
jgi:hypothetical protein